MRLVAVGLALLALAGSGCFGGCYTSSYALAWHDPAVAAALRERAAWDDNVTVNEVGAGLPVDAGLLPVSTGEASLWMVALSWPAETPEMDVSELRLRLGRGGDGPAITGLIDAHLGSARLAGHVDTFLAAVLADPAAAPAVKAAILAEYDPGRHDFSDHVEVAIDVPLALDALVSHGNATWVPERVGVWVRDEEDWRFEALVASWRWHPDGDWRAEIAADAAGHVQGPALPSEDDAAPDLADVEAETAGLLERLGVPPPVGARLVGASRTCVD